ncbi:hypothetical protein BCR35DRAFT_327285 [Leucosporidium creatinivorum]|uniref:SWIM-type domain-containing protein n=1 Tax=Leucosporidium creatinivorum TaxID=106004 RepID=A0A1Y2CP52_9BASI|nr:hypothetical protein BCR35DRAFT_327285 [Leucosporidium creatinivorum]
MNQLRPQPFIAKRPAEITQRLHRRPRGHGTLIVRLPTEKGEKFVVSGMEDNYTVEICSTPSCSCPDWETPCKHMLFVYIDVLYLDESDPLTCQTCFLPSELTEMGIRPNVAPPAPQVLQPTTPAKRIMIDLTSSESPSPKRPRANRPRVELTTDGLDAGAVRQILLFALDKHPEIRRLIDKHRSTPLDGLSAEASRTVLLEIASKHDDVLREIGDVREQENAQVQTFANDVARITRILRSLDSVSEYEVRGRIDEIVDPAEEAIRGIADQLSRFGNSASMHNALAALSEVASTSLSYYVERAMEEEGGIMGAIEMSVVSVLKLMRGEEKAKAIKGLGSLRRILRDRDGGDLESHIHDWEANRTEESRTRRKEVRTARSSEGVVGVVRLVQVW